MATIIKSVVLVPGEKFTLPPESTLIGSSNTVDLTSNCEIPTLEELSCYVAIIAAGADDGSSTQYYEGDAAHLLGYRLNGVVTYFAGAGATGGGHLPNDVSGLFDLTALGTEIKTLLPAIIDTDGFGVSDNDRGGLNIFLIQTIPSIANNLQLVYFTSTPISDPGVGTSDATTYIEFMTRAEAVTAGYNDVPACPIIAVP